MAEICAQFAKSTNSYKAGFGFYEECEKRVKDDIHHNKIVFSDAVSICEDLFTNNIGSTDFQILVEKFLLSKIETCTNAQLISLTNALYHPKYLLKIPQLRDDLFAALALSLSSFDVRQTETLFWTLTRKKITYEHYVQNNMSSDSESTSNSYEKMLFKALMNTVFKK